MRRFDEKEIEYLKENYSILPKKELIEKLNRSWVSIQKKCHFLNLKRGFNESSIYSFSLEKLLNFDNESCYWLGFLLADGHISKSENIQLNLSMKDKNHVLKLERFIGHKIPKYETKKTIRTNISDRPTIQKIKYLFKWKTNKTKYPPIIPDIITGDKLFSLIIGFIDGDGSIKKGGLYVRCDWNWHNLLDFFYFELTQNIKDFKKTTDGCSIFYICRKKLLRSIKDKAEQLSLPIMDRKWKKLDINSPRYQKSLEKSKQILNLLNQDNKMKYKDIERITGCSAGFINKIRNEYGETNQNTEFEFIR